MLATARAIKFCPGFPRSFDRDGVRLTLEDIAEMSAQVSFVPTAEVAILISITSSERARSVGCTVSPSGSEVQAIGRMSTTMPRCSRLCVHGGCIPDAPFGHERGNAPVNDEEQPARRDDPLEDRHGENRREG
jgi:hypothetical protein